MSSSDSNIHQVVYIAVSHIQRLHNSGTNSFTSGRPGEDSTSSTLLRKVWVEEKGTWRNCCITHYVCVCLLDCMYETCVRLLAVLWGMVLLGSSFRKPNTGMGRGPLELWTSSTMTKGRLTSEEVWGDNKSGSRQRRLSWEGCSSRIVSGPSLESIPIAVLLYGAKPWTAVSTFLWLFVSLFMHISLKTGSLFTHVLNTPFHQLLLSIQRQAHSGNNHNILNTHCCPSPAFSMQRTTSRQIFCWLLIMIIASWPKLLMSLILMASWGDIQWSFQPVAQYTAVYNAQSSSR